VDVFDMIMLPKIRIAGDFILKPRNYSQPRKIVDFELIYYPEPPSGIYMMEDRAIRLEKPCIIIQKPDSLHIYKTPPDKAVRHLFVHFTAGTYIDELSSKQSWKDCYLINETTNIPLMLNELMSILSAKRMKWEERGRSLLFVILSELLVQDKEVEETIKFPIEIQMAIRYIAERLWDKISILELSNFVGWSHGHLTRSFQLYLGVNVRTYILMERIERAARLLVSSNKPIREIGLEAGFEDEKYFSRCFRNFKGTSPSEFRKRFADFRNFSSVPYSSKLNTEHPINTYFFGGEV
jgi:AraC family transcriptional regulator